MIKRRYFYFRNIYVFIYGRDAAFKDVLIDALGYAIAIAVCITIRKFMAKEKHRKYP